MLHQMCTSPDAQLRQMAALGMGLYYDFQIASEKPIVERMVADLIDLFGDLAPVVRRAACLGLVGIGNHAALEAVADALLSGDEDLRLYAAEALANHPEEGFPTLREGTSLDDILVRRAVVAGLQRVRQPWAAKTLEEIQLKEEQWVVKNAATRALELIALPNPRIPQPLPALSQTPWFIAFAGERGIGVVPGKPAYELLLKALREGKEEQQLAALEYLRQNGDEIAIETILDVMHRGTIEVREAAFNTLWHLAATYSSE
jgi:HEAT repeat protein